MTDEQITLANRLADSVLESVEEQTTVLNELLEDMRDLTSMLEQSLREL